MRANCELTLPMERQIIISGIGLGLRFFYLMNFFTQSDPPQPAMRVKSPPGTQRQLGGGDLTLIAGWGGSLCVQNSCTRDRFCELASARNSRAFSLGSEGSARIFTRQAFSPIATYWKAHCSLACYVDACTLKGRLPLLSWSVLEFCVIRNFSTTICVNRVAA